MRMRAPNIVQHWAAVACTAAVVATSSFVAARSMQTLGIRTHSHHLHHQTLPCRTGLVVPRAACCDGSTNKQPREPSHPRRRNMASCWKNRYLLLRSHRVVQLRLVLWFLPVVVAVAVVLAIEAKTTH